MCTQIDFILCCRVHLKEDKDCKVIPGQSVACSHWENEADKPKKREKSKGIAWCDNWEEGGQGNMVLEQSTGSFCGKEGNMVYRVAKQRDRAAKDVQQISLIKVKVLTTDEEVLQRWKDYFEGLMNVENPREMREENGVMAEVMVAGVTQDKVKKILKRIKRGDIIPDEWRKSTLIAYARLRSCCRISDEQFGFMYTDAIFALQILMEKYREGHA
ncbi:uncharacterized protein LOC119579658 [Penaeus monodon]|uniref:uncharacterized protein LOC119579658 n=1 Tax=Penaeus monodon TaxID=6687 RepID=UPI0018A6DE08|nr:uncharacterized protein LOC119579658 [Penaeus monodon]